MDPHTFDRMIQRVSSALSRRSLVGGSLSAALLGVVRLGDDGLAKKRVRTERCLAVGERCPKRIKHGQKKVKHTCDDNCCTRFSVVSADGKRRCACRVGGEPCTASTARQCCSGTCQGTVCAPVTATAINPGPAVCPATCATCETCKPATGNVCAVDPSENGEPGTGCAAPDVCCGGTCCTSRPTGVRECNAAGACATCAEWCPATCDFCANLANGDTVCTGSFFAPCNVPCTAHTVCPSDRPFCVESISTLGGPTFFPCPGTPTPGTGFCTALTPC